MKMTDEIPELEELMNYMCYLKCSNFRKEKVSN